MKILRDARLCPKKSSKVTCSRCKSVMEVTNEDATEQVHDFRDGSSWVIPCGVCTNHMWVAFSLLGDRIP